MSVATKDAHQSNRPKIEEILEVPCPLCRAKPGQWCDREGERLTPLGRIRRDRGTPPSHTERMWSRQGHTPDEFPALRDNLRPFGPDQPPSTSSTPAGPPRGVTLARFAAMRQASAAELYREGNSACVVALILGLTRTGAEQKIKRGGLGGNQWCRVHRTYERI